MYLLSLDIDPDPDPRSPITPGCLGPLTDLFNCRTETHLQYHIYLFSTTLMQEMNEMIAFKTLKAITTK